MSNFLQIDSGVDVSPLLAQLEAHPELWNQFDYRKVTAGTPHAGMDDIWIHQNDVTNGYDFGNTKDPIWYPAYQKLPALKKIIFDLMAKVEGERIGFVLITKIPPGGKILPHRDAGWHVDYFDKFYLSIKSNSKAGFYCTDDVLFPKEGEIWRFDNRIEHWVNNDGDDDRITLIICLRTEKYEKHKQLEESSCRQNG